MFWNFCPSSRCVTNLGGIDLSDDTDGRAILLIGACGLHGGKPLYLRAHHYSAVEVSFLAASDQTVAQTEPAYQNDLKLAWTEVAALRAGAVVARPLKFRKHCSRS
ncbi:MAG TPA: hypothetical protein VFF89_10900 [Sphingobium sp.]|nr:hypothetical protein [Sphingobium sp.]